MSRLKTEAEKRIHRLAGFLNWVLQNDAGLSILLGILPPLSSYDMYLMKEDSKTSTPDLGTHISGGSCVNLADVIIDSTEREMSIIADAGGWYKIVAAVRKYSEEASPRDWKFFEDYSLQIRPGGLKHGARGEESPADKLARKYGYTYKTMLRRRKQALRQIAQYVYLPKNDLCDSKENYMKEEI